MTSVDDLEARLGRLDLQLADSGGHLSPERIAVIGAGQDPTPSEAAHLAGCDECVGLLVALGEGLEMLAEEQPQLGALLAAPPPRPSRRAGVVAAVVILGAFGAAAAAAGWMITRSGPDAEAGVEQVDHDRVDPGRPGAPPTEPPRGAVEPGPREVPIVPAERILARRTQVQIDLQAVSQRAPVTRGLDLARLAAQMAATFHPVAPAPPLMPSVLPPELTRPGAPAPGAEANGPAQPPGVAAQPTPRPRARRPLYPTPRLRDTLAEPMPEITLERRGPRAYEGTVVDSDARGHGLLQISTRPAARVFVDGKPIGWTPIIDMRLPAGVHDVRLVYESPHAAEKEQRFRVPIQADRTWRLRRHNIRRDPPSGD